MFVMQAWALWTQADKDLLEDVQKRAVRATSGLQSESYKRKLEELGLTPPGGAQAQAVLWSRSRPESDFLAGAGAGEKASAPVPAPGCCCLA